MSEHHAGIAIDIRTTESLTEPERATVIDVCIAAHEEEEFGASSPTSRREAVTCC